MRSRARRHRPDHVYLTDLSNFGEFSEVRGSVFGSELPSSAAVGVASLLGGVLVEISAVAISQV